MGGGLSREVMRALEELFPACSISVASGDGYTVDIVFPNGVEFSATVHGERPAEIVGEVLLRLILKHRILVLGYFAYTDVSPTRIYRYARKLPDILVEHNGEVVSLKTGKRFVGMDDVKKFIKYIASLGGNEHLSTYFEWYADVYDYKVMRSNYLLGVSGYIDTMRGNIVAKDSNEYPEIGIMSIADVYIYSYPDKILRTVGVLFYNDKVVIIDTFPRNIYDYVTEFERFIDNWMKNSYMIEVNMNLGKRMGGDWVRYAYIPKGLIYRIVDYLSRIGMNISKWTTSLSRINKYFDFRGGINYVVVIDDYTYFAKWMVDAYRELSITRFYTATIEMTADNVNAKLLKRIKLQSETEVTDLDKTDDIVDRIVFRGMDVFKAIRFKKIREKADYVRVYHGEDGVLIEPQRIHKIYKIMGVPEKVSLYITSGGEKLAGLNYKHGHFILRSKI